MLLKIEIENFFSIKNRIVIDFRAANIKTSKAKELSDNVFDWNGTKILKSIGLFGPNASGKSNILKAIDFCCRLILESHQNNEGSVFNFQPFKFDGYESMPSHFLVDFVCEGMEYEYSFTLNRNQILTESLYYYPNGKKKAKVYTRNEENAEKYSFSSGLILKPRDVTINTSNKSLFLSRASSMNRELAQRLYRYFLNTFMLGIVNMNSLSVEDLFKKYKKLILKALSICDLDICDIRIRHDKIPAPVPEMLGNSSIQFQLMDILRFQTVHSRSDKVTFDMEMEESAGTKNLFSILLRLLDVVRNRKSLMLDEFDASFHTRLAEFVLDLIHASAQSQLLFSSHNTNLIDTSRLRRDQIIFVNKQADGSTEIYSLYDFKDFRENMNAEKAYIQGRFDAIPFVDSSVASLKQLLEE